MQQPLQNLQPFLAVDLGYYLDDLFDVVICGSI